MSFMNVLSICAIVSFPFGFKDGMQDLIVLIPDQCLSIYFFLTQQRIITKTIKSRKDLSEMVKVKVKVSHSLIAVGAVGIRVPLYLGHS